VHFVGLFLSSLVLTAWVQETIYNVWVYIFTANLWYERSRADHIDIILT